ncbi:MAG: hypothetical protein MI702_08275 [Chlorobiales bacterium]|nr:hypothetical protein [Chlorobiales bacterium]
MTILFSFTASIGKAQSTQLFSPSDSVPKIELRYLHPFYKSLDKQGLLSGGYDIAFSYPINRTWNVQASIPLLFAKYEFESYYYGYGGGYGYGYLEPDVISKKDNAIGNIMIGVQSNRFLQKNRVFSFDLQLFLPTAPKDYNDAADYAAYANVYEFQKYLWDVTSVAVKGTYSSNPESGWIYAMSGGVMYLIGGSNSGLDDDLCVSYMLGTGYKVKSFTFGIDYQGLINLTNDFLNDFRDRMFDAVNIGAQYSFGNFQPSLFYSVNTRNDLRDFVSGTLGLKLAYRFAK